MSLLSESLARRSMAGQEGGTVSSSCPGETN